jgi:hypothetical protein
MAISVETKPKLRGRPWGTVLASSLCVFALLAGAGCGSSSESEIRDSAATLVSAGVRGDYSTVCSYATPQLLAAYGGEAGCANALAAAISRTGFDFRAVKVGAVSVNGDRAVVTVTAPQTFQVLVQRVGGRWLVAGV